MDAPESSPNQARLPLNYWGARQWFGVAWIGLALLTVLWLVGAITRTPATAAQVEVVTETLEFTHSGGRDLAWDVPGAHLFACSDDGDKLSEIVLEEGRTLNIEPGARFRLEKLDGRPEFSVRVDRADTVNPAPVEADCHRVLPISIVSADGRRHALRGRSVAIEYRFNGHTPLPWRDTALTLPLSGQVVVGQELGDGVQAMLLSGQVSLHASQEPYLIGHIAEKSGKRQTYLAESWALMRGDMVQTVAETGPSDNEERKALGYVRVPAVGGLQVAYTVPAQQARIVRLGTTPIELRLGMWQRFENEPSLTIGISAFAALLALLEVLQKFGEARRWLFGRAEQPKGEEDGAHAVGNPSSVPAMPDSPIDSKVSEATSGDRDEADRSSAT